MTRRASIALRLPAGLALALAVTAPPAARADTVDVGKSLLQVIVTYQDFDPQIPWQKRQPGQRYGYGVMLDGSRLLTTEDLTRNGALIELRRAKRGEKYAATVQQSDYQADLAILKASLPPADGAPAPLALATNVPQGATVQIVQFDETGEIQQEDAKVQKISVSSLPLAPNTALIFTLQTEMNVNGAGAPVVYEGRLAGLIVQYDRATRTATMLPYPMLQRFAAGTDESNYTGIASAGFLWGPLIDPAKREYLGAPANGKGVMILGALPGSGADGVLKPQDVLLAWDGAEVDNLGYYQDPEFGRLLLPYLVSGRHRPGDTVAASIIRDRKPQSVNLKMSRRMDSESLIPENTAGLQAEYVADAGFVIRELSGDYLRSYGPKWEFQVSPRLTHLYLTAKQRSAAPGERIVLLTRVLPDPINVGSQMFRDDIVDRINGQPVKNMRDVFRILDADGSLNRISLHGMEVDIVVDQSELAEANARISQVYGIPKLRYRRAAE